MTWKYPDVKKDAEGFAIDAQGRRVKRSLEEEERQVVDKFVPSNNVQGKLFPLLPYHLHYD